MRRFFFTMAGIFLAIVFWASLLLLAVSQGWTKSRLAPEDDWQTFTEAAIEIIEQSNRGNVGFALIENGKVVSEHFSSIGKTMDGDTLYQMASVSKWISSWGVLKLVEQGRIDLDTPVSQYLTRWQLPATEFDNSLVTVRRLLSHTAGLTDQLGYGGFETKEKIQTLEESLTLASDAMSPNGATIMGAPADGTWRYSGGGYTLMQLLIEEISGQSFNEFMKSEIFAPLGMSRSTYIVARKEEPNLADFYDSDGSVATHYYFTALAAASLYTSTNDLARFIAAHAPGPNGEPPGRGVLSSRLLKSARVAHAKFYGMDFWALGVGILAKNSEGDYMIGHDGGNRPAINTTARVDPSSGDGIVVMSSGGGGLASSLGDEWVFWQVGKHAPFELLGIVDSLVYAFLFGAGVILVVGLLIGWKHRRNEKGE